MGYSYLDKIATVNPDERSSIWPLRGIHDPLYYDILTRRYDGYKRGGVSPEVYRLGTGENVARFNGGYIDFPIETSPVPLFNGASTRINFLGTPLINQFDWNEGTISTWLKVPSFSAANECVIVVFLDGSSQVYMQLPAGFANRVNMVRRSGGISRNAFIEGFTYGNWHNLVMTWNVTNDTVYGFLDGSLSPNQPTGSIAISGTPTVFEMGRFGGGGQWLNGHQGHMAIWSKELTFAQVKSLSTTEDLTRIEYENKVINTKNDSLLIYCPLDELNGTIANNRQGNTANFGTYINATLNDELFTPITKKLPFDKNKGAVSVWFRGDDKYSYHTGKVATLLDIYTDTSNRIQIQTKDNGLNGVHANTAVGTIQMPMLTFGTTYDGATSSTDVNTPALVSAFNGDEGSLVFWTYIASVPLVSNDTLFVFQVDASNRFFMNVSVAANTIIIRRTGSGTSHGVNITSFTYGQWNCIGLTWSVSQDAIQTYYNGAPFGGAVSGLQTFVGSLVTATIGSFGAVQELLGDLGQFQLYDQALTANQMAHLYISNPISGEAYLDRVHAKAPIAYWPLGEPNGTVAYNKTYQPPQLLYTAGGSTDTLTTTTEVRDDEFHNIVAEWNKVGNATELWLDGTQEATGAVTGAWAGDPIKMYAGAANGSVTDFWFGGEAYLGLWTDVLSDNEVALLSDLSSVEPNVTGAQSKGEAIADYQVLFIDPSTGETLDFIDGRRIHSMDYSVMVNDFGTMQLTVLANDRASAYFNRLDLIMEVYRRNVTRFEKEETYFARNFNIFEDNDGVEYLIFGGVSLINFFEYRPINPNDDPNGANGFSTKGGATADPANLADSVMYGYVNDQAINPATNTDRAMPGLSNAINNNLGNPVFARVDYQTTLLQVLKDVSVRGIVDFELRRTTGANFEFEVLHIGTDRTKTSNYPSNPFIYFTENRGNLIKPKLKVDRTNQITRAWMRAQGVDENRVTVAIDSSAKLDSPFNLREMVGDAREVEDNASLLTGLNTAGLAKLDENKGERDMEFSIDNNAPQSRYNVDWFKGDKVTSAFKGNEFDFRIRGVQVKLSKSKDRIKPLLEELTFGSN